MAILPHSPLPVASLETRLSCSSLSSFSLYDSVGTFGRPIHVCNTARHSRLPDVSFGGLHLYPLDDLYTNRLCFRDPSRPTLVVGFVVLHLAHRRLSRNHASLNSVMAGAKLWSQYAITCTHTRVLLCTLV